MTHIYLIKYEKETLNPISMSTRISKYTQICKKSKEITKLIENLYDKNNYIYPKNFVIETIYLSDKEIEKIKELK